MWHAHLGVPKLEVIFERSRWRLLFAGSGSSSPTSILHTRVCEGILIGFFMVKMIRAAQSTINLRCGSLVPRPKLAFVFGFLAAATAVLVALSWFHSNQVDEGHSAQVILNQIAVFMRKDKKYLLIMPSH